MRATLFLFAATVLSASAQDLSDRLYDAIRNDDTAALKTLIVKTADVKDKTGTTPLMYAAAVGSLETMKLLAAAGADVNAKNEFGVTALMWCATDDAKLRWLLSKGADVNARSRQGRTPLLISAATQGSSGIVKFLLDNGADLKKADADPVATPLTVAAAADDIATLRLLLDHGAEVRGPAGVSALGAAAAHGDVEMMRLLLARGVPPDAPTSRAIGNSVKHGDIALGLLTPLHFAVPYGGPAAVKLLIDNKADVNAQDVRGMTPLMLALGSDHANPAVVALLLEHGADPTIESKAGETAFDWARKFNHPEMLRALKIEPLPATVSLNANPPSVNDAVQKGAILLQRTTANFFVESGCSSCHAQNLTSMSLAIARKSGLSIADETTGTARAQQTKTAWASQRQPLMLRMDAPGGSNMTSYGLLEMAADGLKPDGTTDSMVHNIAAQQQVNGSWHLDGISRPPMADGDFTHTALAIRSLKLFSPSGRQAELNARIDRAVSWLRDAKPLTAEDYNMQLLGLVWGGADQKIIGTYVRAAAALQRSDGGWAQSPYLNSDAYATGQTLAALREAGMPPSDPAYKKGVDFLLQTQVADGSWHVASRSPKFQPYFQSGFPHDHDQWISMAGTAWATMALAYSLPGAF